MSNWHTGPWVWNPIFPQWEPPPGCSTGIDLRSLPEQAQAGGTPGLGVFYGDVTLGSDYHFIGRGNWYDIKLRLQDKDALPKRPGYSVKGEDLVGAVMDLLTDGADPEGNTYAKPLVPSVEGRMVLSAGGRTHNETFRWGKHPHTNRLRDLLRSEFTSLFNDAKAGKLKDQEHHRRVLDFWCDKYGLQGENDWQDFVPPNLRPQVSGRLKRDTTYTENFTRADGDIIGNLLTWTEVAGDLDTVSNAVKVGVDNTGSYGRAESDLSGSDHYAQVVVTVPAANGNQFGPACRFSSSAHTAYFMLARPSDGLYRIYKVVAGTETSLFSTNITVNTGTYYIKADGSTIYIRKDGANEQNVTDTSISGNLRGGIRALRVDGFSISSLDDFEEADLSAAPSTTLVQLEGIPRGLVRGLWMRRG